MEIKGYVFLMILGSALVTVLPRIIPLVVLSRKTLPNWCMRWLNYVPIAVMAALVGQELLLTDGQLTPFHKNIELLAALPTFLIAIFTQSLLATVLVGIISMMVFQTIF